MTAQYRTGPTAESKGTKSFSIVFSSNKMCDDCRHMMNFPGHYEMPKDFGYCNQEASDHWGHIVMYDHPACVHIRTMNREE